MRIIITQNITLDGRVEMLDEWFDPQAQVIVTGSITLAHELIAEGLVDEYRMFTYPVWQGRGRGYFHDGAHSARPPRLKLIDAKSFPSGITYSAYEPSA
ncbi:dihydrofolate reductase family protein [Brevibacterium sp. JSBI002]|uniref:dihydrofolate reductase family protein n=1 Tax=Brevibacterium sp. JSBI002 TaxID=2886045 RepID=UPI00222F7B70|nr:dihydrofolate reductase family protein [Brevibacterium sp. JSBI002]UZD62424.1 dihydrofolate reductase family protein [Brevibacterium sp. JSBI002]